MQGGTVFGKFRLCKEKVNKRNGKNREEKQKTERMIKRMRGINGRREKTMFLKNEESLRLLTFLF